MRIIFAAALLCVFSAGAAAGPRQGYAAECNVSMPCVGVERIGTSRRAARGSVSLSGVTAPLAAKAGLVAAGLLTKARADVIFAAE